LIRILFFLFLAIPLIEIYLLIKVGNVIGAWPTVLLVVGTALLGAVLLRAQGLFTYQRVQQTLARGELPAVAMLEGLVLLLSGALLLTPGFFTDTLGFLALIPPLRRWFIHALLRNAITVGMGGPGGFHRPPGEGRPHEQRGPTVIEGDYRRDE
jgi:UPF0716 protein FxsA